MPYVDSCDREQLQIYSLDMLVDSDSIARVIDAFIDTLDLVSLGFHKATPAVEGRPSFPADAMIKLYLYGHRNLLRSSRRLQRACHVNLEVIWLMKGMEPDFRTISDFRKDNISCLKKVFLEFNKRFADLLTGYQSVDGSKFFASNSKDNNFTSSKLDDRIAWLQKHVEEYLRQMDQLDECEELSGTFTAEQLQEKIQEANARLERYEAYKEYMEKNGLSQISLTDPDSRLMKNRNGFTVSHNVQTSVDSNTHMITDFDVTSNPTDYGQLESTLHGIKEDRPDVILESVSDKGYQSEEDMVACLENGIIPNVILPDGQDTYKILIDYIPSESLLPESTCADEISKCLHSGVIPEAYKDCIDSIEVREELVRIKSDTDTAPPKSPFQDEDEMRVKAGEGFFVRDPERNIVICPAGETLRQNTVTKKNRIRYINKMACRNCKFRNQCYKGKKGFKEVEFNKDEFVKPNGIWMKANGKKPAFTKSKVKRELRKMATIIFRPDKQKMANRMCISEHPFGTIKRSLDSSYFLLRGNKKVSGEFALFSLAYNINRVINLLGFEEVMRRMTA